MDPIEHSAIHSRENPRFKLYRSLLSSRAIKKHGLSLVAGPKLVREFLAERQTRVEALLTAAGVPASPRVDRPADVPRVVFSAELFRELDFLGAGPPLLVVRVPDLPVFDPTRFVPGLSLFLPLSDPDNLGAALRSAAAFGVARVVVLSEAAHPFHPRAIRAAAGETWHLQLEAGPAVTDLPVAPGGVPLFALDGSGEDIGRRHFPADLALIVGEEGRGLPAHFLKRIGGVLRIPVNPEVESLNAGVALGIALYCMRERGFSAVE